MLPKAFRINYSNNIVIIKCLYFLQKLHNLKAYRLNNTRHSPLNVLFFNRVAKVGSEALMELLQDMESLNDLTVITRGPYVDNSRVRTLEKQQIQAEWINDLAEGTVYIEHCNWLNFTEFGMQKPIMINLVRDPVERQISWYYYVRGAYKNAIYYKKNPNHPIKPESWFKKDFNDCVLNNDKECQFVPGTVKDPDGNHMRQSLFFCGHSQECL